MGLIFNKFHREPVPY